ncbi:unannotated protein [freshwater metagenome]|uniref:Unannotated protein n=1 Tax=freshwater metagenome TaxID=449393 RepID=A0A6J7GTQ0_9ZZZZ
MRSRVAPNLASVALIEEVVVAPVGGFGHLDRTLVVSDEMFHALEGVAADDLVEAGGVHAAVRVRSVDHPEVRETRHHATEVRASAVRGPGLLERHSSASHDGHRKEVVRRVKARGVDDDVHFDVIAGDGLDPGFGDPADSVGHQRDVVRFENVEDAVLAVDGEGTRGEIGVRGCHPANELWVAELALEERERRVPHELVRFAACVGIVEVRVDLTEVREEPDRHGRAEPHEVRVKGQVPIEPIHLRRVGRAVAGRGHHPLRRALEDDNVFGIEGELRDQLVAARPGADDGEALALEIEVVRPTCGVEARPREVGHPFDVRHLRTVEEAHGGDDAVRPQHALAVGAVDGHLPFARGLVPRRGPHFSVEEDVVAQLEPVRDPMEVALVLRRRAVRVGVAVVDTEKVRVGAALRVDTAPGISVFEPGTADIGVLLDDREGDAASLQLDRGVETAQPATDDDDLECLEPFLWRRRLPMKAARPRVQRQFFEVETHVLVGELKRARKPKARRKAFLVADRDLCCSRVAVGLQELGRLALKQGDVLAADNSASGEAGSVETSAGHLFVAGQLEHQPAEHQRVRVGDCIFDHLIGSHPQLFAHV